MIYQATALAHPNIAFIKYWGLADEDRKIPANGSISMNIGCLSTKTTVDYLDHLNEDQLVLNGQEISGPALKRVQNFMDMVRRLAGENIYAEITSENNFPMGAGVASSASGFAALALAATAALDVTLSEPKLSSLARFGSGSACRSIPDGFAEWRTDSQSGESFAYSIAPSDHWDLVDCIAVLDTDHKAVGSESGMRTAVTSPLQDARIRGAEQRLDRCRVAIQDRNFDALAEVMELDSNMMHAVTMTSDPPLFYWQPQSLAIMKAVKSWQAEGLSVTYTLDAGPNVHVVTNKQTMGEVLSRLKQFPGVLDILKGLPAGPARLI